MTNKDSKKSVRKELSLKKKYNRSKYKKVNKPRKSHKKTRKSHKKTRKSRISRNKAGNKIHDYPYSILNKKQVTSKNKKNRSKKRRKQDRERKRRHNTLIGVLQGDDIIATKIGNYVKTLMREKEIQDRLDKEWEKRQDEARWRNAYATW